MHTEVTHLFKGQYRAKKADLIQLIRRCREIPALACGMLEEVEEATMEDDIEGEVEEVITEEVEIVGEGVIIEDCSDSEEEGDSDVLDILVNFNKHK